MTKLFVTGSTGYIGGDALYAIAAAHPEYEITAAVRSKEKGALVAEQFPNIKLVYGDLSSVDLLTEEASKADIVCHWANADDEGAANALIKGLATHPPDRPGFLIHTSGTGILCVNDFLEMKIGKESEKMYDDWDNVSEVTSLPDKAPHRIVDKIILAAGTQNASVKTAIVCPPCIYGVGRGPDNKRSIQLPELARVTIKQGYGVKVLEGLAHWTGIHVYDLSNVYLRLVEEAVKGGGDASWNTDGKTEGYYFTEDGDFEWGQVAMATAKEAHAKSLIKTDETKSVSVEEVGGMTKHGAFLWGMNSRGKAIRARKLLGWTPKERSIFEELPIALDVEAKTLGVAV